MRCKYLYPFSSSSLSIECGSLPEYATKAPVMANLIFLGNDFQRDLKAHFMAGESARGNDLWFAEALCLLFALVVFQCETKSKAVQKESFQELFTC